MAKRGNEVDDNDAQQDRRLKRKKYEKELRKLQGELCRLQEPHLPGVLGGQLYSRTGIASNPAFDNGSTQDRAQHDHMSPHRAVRECS